MIGMYPLAWLTDPWTYLLAAFVALLLFGKRLPEVGRSLGRGIAEFKKGLHDVQDEVMREDQEHDTPKPKLRPPEDDDETAARKRLAPEDHPAGARDEHPAGSREKPPDAG
jgi:sec-independent protein translocase protein TatA